MLYLVLSFDISETAGPVPLSLKWPHSCWSQRVLRIKSAGQLPNSSESLTNIACHDCDSESHIGQYRTRTRCKTLYKGLNFE